MSAIEPHWEYVNICLSNGLVPSDNKPLPNVDPNLCRRMVSLG